MQHNNLKISTAVNGDLSQFNLANYLREILQIENNKKVDMDIINYIFSKNIDIDAQTQKGFTAFSIALALGNIELIQLFLENGVDINKMITVKCDKKLYNERIEQDADYWQIENFTETMSFHTLNMVVIQKELDDNVIKFLADNNIDLNCELYRNKQIFYGLDNLPEIFFLIDEAIEANNFELVKYIVEKGAKVHKEINLKVAIEKQNLELIKFLLEHGVKPKEKELTFITIGSFLGYCAYKSDETSLEIAKLLIKYGAKVKDTGLLFSALNTEEKDRENEIKNSQEMDFYIPTPCKEEDFFELFLKHGADVNTCSSDNESILISICRDTSTSEYGFRLRLIKKLIKNGADVNHKDNQNYTALMKIYDNDDNDIIEDIIANDDKEVYEIIKKNIFTSEKIMQILLDNGADIDAKNNMGMTALMKYALEGNEKLVKILIDRGADTTIKSEMTAFHLSTDDAIKNIIKNSISNNPQALIKLLTFFTLDTPIKCTTHSWEGSCENKEKLTYNEFILKVKGQWNGIKDELKELSPNLHEKIESFIFKNVDEATIWSRDTGLKLGWSSVDGLKEHVDSSKKPFVFVLKEPIKTNHQTITTFGELVSLFKEEIEVRNDSNMLERIFDDFEIKLNDNDIACNIDSSVKGVDFYTDVERFKSALDIIFDQFILFYGNNSSLDEVSIEIHKPEKSHAKYVELYITHLNSSSNRTSQELLQQVNDGDFVNIKEELRNLCDWSVLDSYENTGYKINYLKSNNVKEIEVLDKIPDGFTHILRFYK